MTLLPLSICQKLYESRKIYLPLDFARLVVGTAPADGDKVSEVKPGETRQDTSVSSVACGVLPRPANTFVSHCSCYIITYLTIQHYATYDTSVNTILVAYLLIKALQLRQLQCICLKIVRLWRKTNSMDKIS